MHKTVICCLFLLIFFSCRTGRNLVYFDDLRRGETNQMPINNNSQPRIQQNDLLNITVSSLNPESNILFNSGVLLPAGNTTNTLTENRINEGYLVDMDGNINFPVIGRIQLGGLTKAEATIKMTALLTKYIKNPIINIRYLNFKVTVIGEVNRPNTFIVPSEQINVLEALGLAGDMTTFGRRENVLIVREKNGIRTTTSLNLNDKEVLNSPFYYLQQNDIVYVEPHNRSKVAQTSANNRLIPILVSAISAFAIYLSNVNR